MLTFFIWIINNIRMLTALFILNDVHKSTGSQNNNFLRRPKAALLWFSALTLLFIMQHLKLQPSIQLTPSQTRPVILLLQSPEDAKLLSSMCEKSKELGYQREYRSFDCFHDNQHFTVMSHGTGAPGAAICYQELIQNKAKVLIEVGTALRYSKTPIHPKLIACHSAIREDTLSTLVIPKGFPAIADPYVTEVIASTILRESQNNCPNKFDCYSTLLSTDTYKTSVYPDFWEKYDDVGIHYVAMEPAALFVISKLHRVRAGGLYFCIDNSNDLNLAMIHQLFSIAIKSAVKLAKVTSDD